MLAKIERKLPRQLEEERGRLLAQLLMLCFFFNDTATTEIYTVSDTLSLHDALPISDARSSACCTCTTSWSCVPRSEEHTSELQSPDTISYAVFCLKKNIKYKTN